MRRCGTSYKKYASQELLPPHNNQLVQPVLPGNESDQLLLLVPDTHLFVDVPVAMLAPHVGVGCSQAAAPSTIPVDCVWSPAAPMEDGKAAVVADRQPGDEVCHDREWYRVVHH